MQPCTISVMHASTVKGKLIKTHTKLKHVSMLCTCCFTNKPITIIIPFFRNVSTCRHHYGFLVSADETLISLDDNAAWWQKKVLQLDGLRQCQLLQ